MASNIASVDRKGTDPYRKMKCSQGGVMLLVRLHADLIEEPKWFIQKVRRLALRATPHTLMEEGSGLAVTYQWLERKFGADAARRAIVETAEEILGATAE